MTNRPIGLTPLEGRVLVRCPLHYHFLQQKPVLQLDPEQAALHQLVRETIQTLHVAGGPARMTLADCLKRVNSPAAREMIERYYRNLERDWSRMMAGNETMRLSINLGGVPLRLEGTVDRLDQTSDGGILVILFGTGPERLPSAEALRRDHATTIYHALVASTYPLKRPVRLQKWSLRSGETVTVELSEEEYRHQLRELREPVQALRRGEVMARPGLHCDHCPFKYRGCPVYAHEAEAQEEDPWVEISPDAVDQEQGDDFASSRRHGKIPPRKWIFRI